MTITCELKIGSERLHEASDMLLGSNLEGYENTVPWMLSNRLRNSKFSGPEDPQTGYAPHWGPVWNRCMGSSVAKLIPGMSLSGNECQMICNYSEAGEAGLRQTRVCVRKGESLELEVWARTKDTPTTLKIDLRPNSETGTRYGQGSIEVNTSYWSRYTLNFDEIYQDDEEAQLVIYVSGDSYVCFDQIHLRPKGEPNVSQALLDRFKTLTLPTLRFPGGCISCNYHWKHSVGPVHLRPVLDDPVFKLKTHYEFGTDEYLEICRDNGIRPFITLNVTTATPEECAEWAAYCRAWWEKQGLEAPLTYFMFGNENYGNHEIGHMTGEMYAELLSVFVPPVREAYPGSRMVAIGEHFSEGQRESQVSPMLDTIAARCGEFIDVFGVTRYRYGPVGGTLDERMRAVSDGVAVNHEELLPIFEAIERENLNATVGVVEWNYWEDATHADEKNFHEVNDIRHCLFAAGMINLHAHCGDKVEIAQHYSLITTMGALHVRNGQVTDSDLLKVFDLYAPAFPGKVRKCEHNAPLYGEKGKSLSALAIENDETLYVFIANYHSSEAVNISLEGLPDFSESRMLWAENLGDPVREEQVEFEGPSLSLPPMSVIRLKART